MIPVIGALRRRVAIATLSLSVLVTTAGPGAQGTAIAVVVHPGNDQERMTTTDLCDILLGERQRWANGDPIDVFVPPTNSQAWSAVLRGACRTTAVSFRRQVAGRRAFGRATRPLRTMATDADIKQRVGALPRALGFIITASVDLTVKALLIDGKPPSDPAYPLRPAPEPSERQRRQ